MQMAEIVLKCVTQYLHGITNVISNNWQLNIWNGCFQWIFTLTGPTVWHFMYKLQHVAMIFLFWYDIK